MKLVISLIWLGLFAAVTVLWLNSGIELRDMPQQLDAWLSEFGPVRAALIYIVLYTLRSLVLFPAAILTAASGLVFGPWLGILLTAVGENISANASFGLSRWLGRDWIGAHQHGVILHWDAKMRENALMSVLVMRLVYLPFDAVNFGCGLTSMRHRDYFIGTFIGIIPGMVSFVLLGGSVAANVENRQLVFGSAVVFFVAGLAIARLLRGSTPEREEAE